MRSVGGPGPLAKAILEQSGLPGIDGLASAAWRGTPALTRRASRLAVDRVFSLGDAAGFVEPFTGEGISWSIAAAEILAPFVARAIDHWDRDLDRQWSMRLRRLLLARQLLCRGLAGLLRRPACAKLLLAILARAPVLARPFVARINKPEPIV
jgi:flavin-dependent dehydrogenase